MISIDHSSFVISIPKSDTVFVETNALTGYEVRSYDEYALMRELANYLDSEAGATLPNAFTHNTSVTISGVVYARALVILAPYSVTFEAGAYQVKLVGGTNNNLLDVLNPNNVSVIPANSAGLQTVNTAGGGGATAAEVWSYGTRTLTSATAGGDLASPMQYKASSTTTESDPGAGRLRWNNATQASATEIYLDAETNGGTDVSNFLSSVPAGSTLYIQDKDDATIYQRWLVVSIVDNVGWVTLTVSQVTAQGGNIPNNGIAILMFNNAAFTVTAPTAEENAAATIAALIEGGLTLRDVLRIVLSVTAGDATGLEGATMAFKSIDGTKNRVEATYAAGDRTVTGRDPS